MSGVMEFEGHLVQIDYRPDGTIAALHAETATGPVLIAIDLPAAPMEPLSVGQERAVFLDPERRPAIHITTGVPTLPR